MDIRSTMTALLVTVGLCCAAAPAWADETAAPKSESTPSPTSPAPAVSAPTLVPPKPLAPDTETKPPVKAPVSGVPAESSGKETAPGKTESTPTPSKPKPQEGEAKPSVKAPASSSSPVDNGGKESAPIKPESPMPKPKAQESESKPSAKGSPSVNGSAASKSVVQPPAEIVGKDGAPMVLVPAGEFTMGSDKGDDDESPVHRVYVDTLYLDKFEVTNGRFAKFVEAIQSEPPWGFSDKDTPVVHADRPVRWVSWMDAMGYCLWADKRLPTEAEWEKAARGTDGRIYPWGNEAPTPTHAVFGLKEGGGETVSPIGNRDKGKSVYGVHDLAGNLYEWVMDWYAEDFYANFAKSPAINPRGPSEGTAKVQRGGSYINNLYRLRSSFRTKGDPTEQDPNVGFRCAQDVPKLP
ncbi:MAG: FGE-sulfatase domain-containing protein [Nitrospira sp.]|nr:MAG: FGE-sulfatase domain-containing protein [Nitrospira sp.]